MRRAPPPHRVVNLTSSRHHGHFSRITGSAVIRISPSRRRTTNRILDAACFPSRPVRAGRLLRAQLMHAISLADTLSFNRWAGLWRGISFYSSNRNSALEEIFPSSRIRHPCCRLLLIVPLESLSNCREISNCAPRNIRWIGWGAMAIPWARRTFAPMALMVFMPPLACAGLSEDTGAKEPLQTIDPAIQEPWGSSRRKLAILPGSVLLILCHPTRWQVPPIGYASRVHAPLGD